MEHKILSDYIAVKKTAPKLLERYNNRLPEQILDIWKERGFGMFMSGFIRTIDPTDFEDLVQRAYFRGG